jgi:hypothetical protein
MFKIEPPEKVALLGPLVRQRPSGGPAARRGRLLVPGDLGVLEEVAGLRSAGHRYNAERERPHLHNINPRNYRDRMDALLLTTAGPKVAECAWCVGGKTLNSDGDEVGWYLYTACVCYSAATGSRVSKRTGTE